MPKKLPENSVTDVVICRLEGRSREETYKKTGVSETKVQQIWNDFRQKVGDATFEALSDLGKFIHSKGLSYVQWTDEFCIRSRLDKLSVKIDVNLDSFADDLYLVCKEYKINPTTIVKEIINLRNLSSQSRVPIGKMSQHYSEIKSETEQLRQEKQQLSQENTQLRKDATTATKERSDALAQKRVTLQELNAFSAAKQGLGKFVDVVKDLPTLAKVLAEVKNNGWSSSQIIAHLTAKSSYTEQIAQQKTVIDSNDLEILKQNHKINNQATKIESNATTIANQETRIKELKRQDTQTVQVYDIRTNLYEMKIQEFDIHAKESLRKVQENGTNIIEQTTKKITEDQEKFFADQRKGFAAMFSDLDGLVSKIGATVENVSAHKFIQPLYKMLALKSTTFETVQSTLWVMDVFMLIYPRDPRHQPLVLKKAEDFLIYLKGDLKRRS